MIKQRRRRHGGFTLMELLVVLAILGLLVSLVGPQVLNQLGGAKSKTARIQIRDLEQALEMYKLDVGRFPSTNEGLDALVAKPGDATGWNGRRSSRQMSRAYRLFVIIINFMFLSRCIRAVPKIRRWRMQTDAIVQNGTFRKYRLQ